MAVRHPRQRTTEIGAALDRIPLPVYTIDRGGTIDWANPAAVDSFGDIVGRRYTHIFAPESLHAAHTAFARKRVGAALWTEYEAYVVRADGTRVRAEISSVALEEDGDFMGVFGVLRPAEALPAPQPLRRELTPRQLEVLRYLARGCSTDQIAVALGLSVDTVRNHIRDLLKRLDVHTRLGAVVAAHERGLL